MQNNQRNNLQHHIIVAAAAASSIPPEDPSPFGDPSSSITTPPFGDPSPSTTGVTLNLPQLQLKQEYFFKQNRFRINPKEY
jgi:hypothetical protein